MQYDWRTRFRKRMEHLQHNGASLARAAGVKRTAVYDALDPSRSKSPGIDLLKKLCKELGMTVAELVDNETVPPIRVPVIGEIVYTDRWKPYESGKKLPDILDLWTTNDDLVAVRVLENTMSPRFQRNDIVLGNKVVGDNADNYIGLICIVETVKKENFVKVLTRGTKPGTYTLRALDPTVEDVENVRLAWFAPVVAILPQNS